MVFVQSSALVAEFSEKGDERPYMAFFDSVIDLSFPAMPLIVTYLAMFGLKTPLLMLMSLMALSNLTFPALKKLAGQRFEGEKSFNIHIRTQTHKELRKLILFKIGALPKMGEILWISPQFIRYI